MIFLRTLYGAVDFPQDEDFTWSWQTPFWSNGLRKAWSTDVTIPKTTGNLHALQLSNPLDGYRGEKIPGFIQIGGRTLDVDVVVGSISDEGISISLYERIIDEKILQKSLKSWFKDDNSTIYKWYSWAHTDYPEIFRNYVYGMDFNRSAAQRHPSCHLNPMIEHVNQVEGIQLPLVPDTWCALSTGKKVCPQNTIQMMEVYCEDSECKARGGQHVVNDLKFTNPTTGIYFNRGCKARVTVWVSFDKKGSVTTDSWFRIIYDYNDSTTNIPTQTWDVTIPTSQYANGVWMRSFDLTSLQHGDGTMSFKFGNDGIGDGKFNVLNAVLRFEYYDYDDSDEDTEELQYIPRRPRLLVTSNDGWFKVGGVEYTGVNERYIDFDGKLCYYHYNRTGHVGEHLTMSFGTEDRTFSYFGLYWNLPDITIADFLYSTAILQGKKASWKNGVVVHGDLVQKTLDEMFGEVIEEKNIIIDNITMNDTLGMENFIALEGGEVKISDLDGNALVDSYDIITLPITYVGFVNPMCGKVNQYSDPEYDPERDIPWSCDFEQPDGFCIMKTNQFDRDLGRIDTLYDLKNGLEYLKYCLPTRVKIRQITSIMPDIYDIITVKGHDIMVMEGEMNKEEVIYEGLLMRYIPGQVVIPHEPSDQESPDHDFDDPSQDDDYFPEDPWEHDDGWWDPWGPEDDYYDHDDY